MTKHKHDNCNCSRRRFLGGAGAASAIMATGGLGTVLNTALAEVGSPGGAIKDRYFVFVYFGGGWDVLLSLDPRDPIQFNAGNMLKTRILPGYELLDDDGNDGSLIQADTGVHFGPYMGDLATSKHAKNLCVVRGMSMDTLTHEVGRRRFLTGKSPTGLLARGSSAATWLASQLGAKQAIPNLSVRVESYNVDQPNYATGLKVASVPDLIRSLAKSDPALEAKLDKQLDALLTQFSKCNVAQASPVWQAAEMSRQKAREMVSNGFDSLFNFQAKTEAMAKLRDHYGIAESGTAALHSPEAQAAMAATTLTAGITRVVSIQANVQSLDTHFDEWTTDHGPILERGFNAVARLVEDLGTRQYYDTSKTWLDHTTIIGFSEFSRTPLINSRLGRDHALMNACFLMGAGINGGTVVGSSSDVGMAPMPIDLSSGNLDANEGEIIYPEHVIRALFHDVGIEEDIADLRVEPLKAILKTS